MTHTKGRLEGLQTSCLWFSVRVRSLWSSSPQRRPSKLFTITLGDDESITVSSRVYFIQEVLVGLKTHLVEKEIKK